MLLRVAATVLIVSLVEISLETISGYKFHPDGYKFVTYVHEFAFFALGMLYLYHKQTRG